MTFLNFLICVCMQTRRKWFSAKQI